MLRSRPFYVLQISSSHLNLGFHVLAPSRRMLLWTGVEDIFVPEAVTADGSARSPVARAAGLELEVFPLIR